MTIYRDSDQLYSTLRLLFDQVGQTSDQVGQTLSKSRLIIRLWLTSPPAEILLDGRKNPPQVIYGASTLKPDLDIELSANALHFILLGELTLGRALSTGQLKVRGPVWKSFILEEIFHRGQALYPQVIQEIGIGD